MWCFLLIVLSPQPVHCVFVLLCLNFRCCDVYHRWIYIISSHPSNKPILQRVMRVNSLWRFKTQQTSQINQLTPLFPSCLEVVSVLTGIGSLSYLPKNGLNMQLLHLILLTRAFLVFSLNLMSSSASDVSLQQTQQTINSLACFFWVSLSGPGPLPRFPRFSH